MPGAQSLGGGVPVLETGSGGQLAELFGADAAANVFSLSVGPLMNAHLILGTLQLLPPVRRHLGLLRQQGQGHVVERYVTSLFVISGLVQAVALSYSWANQLGLGAGVQRWAWVAASSACLMLGAVICRALCDAVEKKGLGDGLGLFIATGTSLACYQSLRAALTAIAARTPPLGRCFAAAALVLPLIAIVIRVQSAELRLPLAYHRGRGLPTRRGNPAAVIGTLAALRLVASSEASKTVGVGPAVEKGSYFPISLSPQGTRTLLFVNFWVSMFRWPLSTLGLERLLASPWTYAALIFLVEAPNIGDTSAQLAEYLAMGEAGVQGVSPGSATAAVLSRKRQQLRLLNAAFLAAIWLISGIVDGAVALLIGAPAGVLPLLLLASIYTGMRRQLAALSTLPKLEMEMRRERELLRAAAEP